MRTVTSETEPEPPVERRSPSRRALLTGATGGLGIGAVLGARLGSATLPKRTALGPEQPAPIDPFGTHQAGIARPQTPQRNGCVGVFDLPSLAPARITAALVRISDAITHLTTTAHPRLPDGPRDLTITIGLGPRPVQALGPKLPGAEDLPEFHSDEELSDQMRGGDLFVSCYSSDPNDVLAALREVGSAVDGMSLRWLQRCFRPHGEGTIARNPLTFYDGIIVPRTPEELSEHVWLPEGPTASGTILVVRRMRLATERFHDEPVSAQEEIIGRRRCDGAPLSGGGQHAQVDLRARSPEGELLTPDGSHVRSAHPSFTGSHLMLRRSYAFDNGGADHGLLFMCFQRDLQTFVRTQYRLDEVDRLMGFVTVTASATFLVLPGFSKDTPLGAALRA